MWGLSGVESTLPASYLSFVRDCMSSFKCSAHDESHCLRVTHLARRIASEEAQRGTLVDMRIVTVAALSHDVLDSKLLDICDAFSVEKQLVDQLDSFLPVDDRDKVLDVVKSVGYKNLLKHDWNPSARSIEYRCVQDADLLDAIGAVGIGRCYSFGGGSNSCGHLLFKLITNHDDGYRKKQRSLRSRGAARYSESRGLHGEQTVEPESKQFATLL